jgi:hypothetical protein
MEPRVIDDGYPELDFDWGDFYRRRHAALGLEERGGDAKEVAWMRDEAEAMLEALRHRHTVELDYQQRHGVDHPRRIARLREHGWGVPWGPSDR